MSDIEILKEIRSGNYNEFSKLYNKYFQRIYRYIYSKTYRRESAEDICSSTFIKALENIANFKGDGSKLVSWLYTIARNQITDYYRSNRSEKNVEDLWDLSSKEDIEVDIINRENFEKLHKELNRLKGMERDIIILHLWEDMTFKDVSISLGLKEGRCKMIFYRALDKMKKSMEEFISVMLFLKHQLPVSGGQYE